VGLFITTLIDRPASFKYARHQNILQTPTGAQGSYSCPRHPTYGSRDKHLPRQHINKNNRKEIIFLHAKTAYSEIKV